MVTQMEQININSGARSLVTDLVNMFCFIPPKKKGQKKFTFSCHKQ